MTGLGHWDGVPMVSALVRMVTYWTKPMVSDDIGYQVVMISPSCYTIWFLNLEGIWYHVRSIIDILKFFCWRSWYMYNMIYDIKFNYIVSVDKKYEFCKCTLIIKLHEIFDFIKYQQFVHITL